MPGYDECLIAAELRARAAYSEPHRRYHDQRHLDESLARLASVHGLGERDRRLLGWAILWHDAVYDPARDDNEEQSAGLARLELLGCGVAQADAEEVAKLIRLTKSHLAEKQDRLGALIVSIDHSVLGSDPDRYRAYAADVRSEYAHLSDKEWRAGRAAVLKRLLAADPLFPDPLFRDRFERQARMNMADELRILTEG